MNTVWSEEIQGVQTLYLSRRLRFDDIGEPMLQVFSTCAGFIRTLPTLVYSSIDPEDVDSRGEDHLYDQCRYVMMKRRIAQKVTDMIRPHPFDPLNIYK